MSISLIEVNVKPLTRWHYIPSRLAVTYPDTFPLCFRGCNLVGSMFHTWWSCPCIRTFWNKVFHLLRKVTVVAIPQDSKIALLSHKVHKCSKHTQTLVFFMLPGAKITLDGAWKKPSISFLATKQKMSWIMTQEQIMSKIQDKMQKFEAILEP